jgi:Highly conserved protein containing a thioredoxin domain
MKKYLALLILVCIPLSMMSQRKGTVFEKGTFAQALAKAKQENKNVFVDCYTQWCGPCHYMSTDVFPLDSIGNFMNSRFVSIQIDMEHGEGPVLQKKFGVRAYPTFIIFNGNGDEVGRFLGLAVGQEFYTKVNMALKGVKDVNKEVEKLKKKETVKEQVQPEEKDTIYDEGKGVTFEQLSFADALAKAQRENKRIFVDCYTSWCHACLQMAKTTFKDTRVGNFMNNQFINLQINTEKDPDGKMIADKYKLGTFPTFLILNPDGTEYNRIVGRSSVISFCTKVMKAMMGEEDESVKMDRLSEEYFAKMRKERQANLSNTPAVFPATKVKFEKNSDISKALKKAQKLHRPVMVFISNGDWRAKYMFDNIFTDNEAADYLNKTFVNVEADANSVSGDVIITKYNLSETFPAYLIISEDGKMKGCIHGLRKHPDILIESLNDILNYKPQSTY